MLSLSIIVPTYNRSNLLIPTLEALVNQDAKNYEIIVIDDGSTDNTEEIVTDFITNNTKSHIRFYKVSNQERGAARNIGVKKAKGDYVNFFDSDDLAYPYHVTLFQQKVISNSIDVFSLSYDIKNISRKLSQSVILKNSVASFISKGNQLSCNGVFIKRQVALDNPFSEIRELSGSEDYELWLRLAAQFDFPCFSEVSHAVIQHDERSTMNFDPLPLIKRKLLMLDLAFNNEVVMNRFGSSKNIMRSSAYSYIALHIAMTGKSKPEGTRWFWKSLIIRPSTLFSRRTLAIFKHLIFS